MFLILSYNSDKKINIKGSSVRSFHNKQQDKNNNNNLMRKLVARNVPGFMSFWILLLIILVS